MKCTGGLEYVFLETMAYAIITSIIKRNAVYSGF